MTIQYAVALHRSASEETVLETCFEMGWELRYRTDSYDEGLRAAQRFGTDYFITDLINSPVDADDLAGLKIVSLAPQGEQRSLYSPPFHRNFIQIPFSDNRQLKIGLLNLVSKSGEGRCVGITSVAPNLGRTLSGIHLLAEIGSQGKQVSLGALNPGDGGAHRLLAVPKNLLNIERDSWQDREIFKGAHLLNYCDTHPLDLCDDLRKTFDISLIDLGPSYAFHLNENRVLPRRYFEAIDAIDTILLLLDDSPKGVAQALDLLKVLETRTPHIALHLCFSRSSGDSPNVRLLESRGYSSLSIPDAARELIDVERGKGLVGERHRRSAYRDAILRIAKTLQEDISSQSEIHSVDARAYRGLGWGPYKRTPRTI